MKGLCEVVDNIDKEVDRISELPEHILHDILSLLRTKDATKTCVLSKTWNSAWSSFPLLDFNYYAYSSYNERGKEKAQDFINYVNSSIARRCQNTSIRRFSLYFDHYDLAATKSRLELQQWLNDTVNVQHLSLHCSGLKITFALFRSKSLKDLKLYGCDFNAAVSGIDHNSIACFSLKRIILNLVAVDDHTLQSLLSNTCAPSLEEVIIVRCYGFRSLSFCSTKHRSVHVHLDMLYKVQKITIKSPNLRFLELGGKHCGYVLTTTLEEASKYNKNLKELVLSSVDIDYDVVQAIQDFGVLEKLKLFRCRVLERIRISSYQPSNLAIQLKNKELVASCEDCRENGTTGFFEDFNDGLYKLEVI